MNLSAGLLKLITPTVDAREGVSQNRLSLLELSQGFSCLDLVPIGGRIFRQGHIANQGRDDIFETELSLLQPIFEGLRAHAGGQPAQIVMIFEVRKISFSILQLAE